MPRPQTLTPDQVRRTVLAAQGFDRPRVDGRIDRRHVDRVFRQLGLLQIDSVNVLVRSHYLPLFSRLGPYDPQLLDRYVYDHREGFEYWGHVASLIRSDLHPALRWRMTGGHGYAGLRRWAADNEDLLERVHDAVIDDGPLSASDLEGSATAKGPWWGWGDTKQALEVLFHDGRVGAQRRGNFERVYCDPADALPEGTLDVPTPTEPEALRTLLEQSARGHGVGTATDLADYFRLPIRRVRPLLDEMVAEGTLEQVSVPSWTAPAYRHPEARLPRRIDAAALVSPFDSVMWDRDRIERVFDFHYRIEIYVPEPKRVHGYYVLPFLLDDRYVARVDLKADRAGGRLLVQSAHLEPGTGADPDHVAVALLTELRTLAGWLDLDDVTIRPRGDLSPALAVAAAA